MDAHPAALLVMDPELAEVVYPRAVRARLAAAADVTALAPAGLADHPKATTEVLLTGWGTPPLDGDLLDELPRLAAVLHAAGSIRPIVTPALWSRRVPIVSAAAANAVPVAEFTVAQIVLGLKQAHRYARTYRAERALPARWPVPGACGSTVGLVSLGEIGRLVAQRLRSYDVHVMASDPYADARTAGDPGVELVALPELFARSDVVSVHAPWLPETEAMVTGDLVASMREGATLINTARGAVVDEQGLVRVLGMRPDLTAVLDVTWPEPPATDSALYDLPNVVLTPHIAGSMDAECARMGMLVAGELERLVAGEPLQHVVEAKEAERRA
ncbi:MAG: hydroxyacid dehydrogenase [Streptosporangiales bacterium]